MKKILFFLAIVFVGFTSCDKVENIKPQTPETNGTFALYPDGDSADYVANVWPTFTTNPNTDRNVLIEDFTGHQCTYCPAAAALALQLEENNPDRVVVSTIHAGPTGGIGDLQAVDVGAGFVIDFTNSDGLEIGYTFGAVYPGSPFEGNPFGSVSRIDHGNGYPVLKPLLWENATNSLIAANDNKVNLQAVSNYYPSTRGFFLHTEIDVLDANLSSDDLNIVVHLLEDSIIAPQKYPSSIDHNYEHRDIFRGSIDGLAFGKALDTEHLTTNSTYEYLYIYELPVQYNPENMHVIIYVRDSVTEEVYQVIKQHF